MLSFITISEAASVTILVFGDPFPCYGERPLNNLFCATAIHRAASDPLFLVIRTRPVTRPHALEAVHHFLDDCGVYNLSNLSNSIRR